LLSLLFVGSAWALENSNEGKEAGKSKAEVENTDATKKADTPTTDPKEKADVKEKDDSKKLLLVRPEPTAVEDSTSNSLNKYNFIFYFIYKYKYESEGESFKKWFE